MDGRSILLEKEGTEEDHFYFAEGKCDGRVSGRFRSSNHPHRRTDETFAMNLQGFIKTVDSALIMLSRQSPNGTWNLEGDWFREGDFFYPSGKGRKAPVSIGQMGKPSKWITLNCYRVLTQTGDLETPLDFR